MKYSYLPNDNLLLAVIRRIDLDCDAKLNYNEFMDAIRPLEEGMVQKKRPRSAIKSSRQMTTSCQYKYIAPSSHRPSTASKAVKGSRSTGKHNFRKERREVSANMANPRGTKNHVVRVQSRDKSPRQIDNFRDTFTHAKNL